MDPLTSGTTALIIAWLLPEGEGIMCMEAVHPRSHHYRDIHAHLSQTARRPGLPFECLCVCVCVCVCVRVCVCVYAAVRWVCEAHGNEQECPAGLEFTNRPPPPDTHSHTYTYTHTSSSSPPSLENTHTDRHTHTHSVNPYAHHTHTHTHSAPIRSPHTHTHTHSAPIRSPHTHTDRHTHTHTHTHTHYTHKQLQSKPIRQILSAALCINLHQLDLFQ